MLLAYLGKIIYYFYLFICCICFKFEISIENNLNFLINRTPDN